MAFAPFKIAVFAAVESTVVEAITHIEQAGYETVTFCFARALFRPVESILNS